LNANHITASCAALSPAFVDRQSIHPPPPTEQEIRNQRDRVTLLPANARKLRGEQCVKDKLLTTYLR
ncbi:MAG: hypothetical protein FWC07_01860, partial [Defluviitaleaceae bacterium]|nr:hypothetical protein [Defluviitaleaceae bacterium]